MTNDVDNIATSLSMTISQLLTAVLTIVAVLVMMVVVSPLLALITIATVPLSLLAVRAITRRSRAMFVAQWASTGRLNAHIEETYSGFTVVRTFGHRASAQEKFAELNDDVYGAGFGAQFLSGLVSPATMVIGNLGYVAVAVIGGFFRWPPARSPWAECRHSSNTSGSSTSRWARSPGCTTRCSPAWPARAGLRVPRRARRTACIGQAAAPGDGRVEFQHVRFGYRPGKPVIEDLSLTAPAGSTVAIVGPTGAGKTTLVNLLMRFYDVDAGRILLDGVDIRSVTRHSLRSRIGMVLQDTWLFGGTIAENIAYGRPDATEDDVVAAARAAHADPFVRSLPNGYQTRISDEGPVSAPGRNN